MTRLSRSTLDRLPADVARPRYDRSGQQVGIVHLGIGAFQRAHQAAYVDDRLAAGERDWMVLGASLRSAETRDALMPQDGLYSVVVRSGDDNAVRVIGAVRDVLVVPEGPEPLLAAMASPHVRIVSLTVTEKGYCHDPASGALREDHPDIRRDLADPARPHTAPGLIVEALRRRRAAGVAPFTVLSCDNLSSNGAITRGIVSRFAALRDADLGRFVAGEVAFPATMVDRITPATTEADRAMVADRLWVADAWPVITEPFSQWVIEDCFPTGRPRFEEAGAELVSDVEPYEAMKLRLLNGAHSLIAYLGYLAGHETVADTIAQPAFARLVRAFMDAEVTPTLHRPPGADLDGYKAQLLARFANTALKHRTLQIAMDGSQKLPPRLLGTVRDRLRVGAPIDRLALVVAGWMRFVSGRDEAGRAVELRDPMAARLREIADEAGPDATRLARALFGIGEIFGDDLPADPRFTSRVERALESLFERGAARTVEAHG
ncbi:mannitol dehydrogenase family protein [Ancylobacter terrae]|uniref:mannitol dehydrogenase family protein n=1 Tax=Ancylobacter sp. sgz301288 TaxID=3342077 RepID=UPI00385A7F85